MARLNNQDRFSILGHGEGPSVSRRSFLGGAASLTAVAALWPGETLASNGVEEFDFVVVGAGSAGSVLANKLSARPASRVLLLEAGPSDRTPLIQDPGNYYRLRGTQYDWAFNTLPQRHLNQRVIGCPRGRALGGTSSINAMLYVRGHPLDYDYWSYLGNRGWSYREVLPYFIAAETNPLGPSPFHGNSGPLTVSNYPNPGQPGTAFVQAAMQHGFSGPDWDFNGARQGGGAGFYQFTVRNGLRCSSAKAFLDPVLGRPNLQVRTGAQVLRLLNQGQRIVGLEYVAAGLVHRIRVTREVVLAAGAIASPWILMLSGIGPADDLRRVGIAPILDLPGVGSNLQDHAIVPVDYAGRVPFPPIFGSGTQAGLFVNTHDDSSNAVPNLQFHFWQGNDVGANAFSLAPTLVRPHSVGRVRLWSADPRAYPLIDPNYMSTQSDFEVMRKGIKLARELARQSAFDPIRGPEVNPGPQVRTDAEIDRYLRGATRTIFHVSGTCKMGLDAMAVVDPELRVHGLQGLRVADASIMPTIINANTNATCIMIGQKASDLILAA